MFKLLYTRKSFREVLEKLRIANVELDKKDRTISSISAEKNKIKSDYEKLQNDYKKISSEKEKLETDKLKLEIKVNELTDERDDLVSKLRLEQNTKGGYVKENNKLKKEKEQFITEISKLEEQIKDLKSDRYVRKPIRADRTKSTIKTKIAPPMKSSVIRFMKQEHGE